MRYEVTIWFLSPLAEWGNRAPAANEILVRRRFRWRLWAQAWAANAIRGWKYVAYEVKRV